MFHEIKYKLKTLFRSKEFIFWTVAFPVILATLFNFAFANLGKETRLEPISIVIIDDAQYQASFFKDALEQLSEPNSENHIFNLTKSPDETDAQKLITENKVVGYVRFDKTPLVVLGNNSIEATVFHQIMTQMYQTSTAINQVAITTQDRNGEVAKAIAAYQQPNYEIVESGRGSTGIIVISFYSLMAMTCLYGAIIGMFMVNSLLPKMSQTGKRSSISPSRKLKQVFGSALAGYVGQWLASSVLFVYLAFVLKIDFGNNLLFVYLFTSLGSLGGLAMGIFLASVINVKEELKVGIIISVTMAGSFLSGMMSPSVKFYVDHYMPFLNWINPSNMITDGLYALSTYSTYDRFLFNVVSLIVFIGVMLLISVWSLRRQTYDSI